MKVIVSIDRPVLRFFTNAVCASALPFVVVTQKRSSLIYRCLGVSRRHFVLKFPRLLPHLGPTIEPLT